MKNKIMKFLDDRFKYKLVKQRIEDLIWSLYYCDKIKPKQYNKCLNLIQKMRDVINEK